MRLVCLSACQAQERRRQRFARQEWEWSEGRFGFRIPRREEWSGNRERIRHDLRQVQTKFWPRRIPMRSWLLRLIGDQSSFTGKSRFPGDYFKHGLEFPIRLDFLLFGNGSFDQAGAGVKGEGVGPDFSTANGNDEFSSPLGVQPSRDPGVPSSGEPSSLRTSERADFLGVPPMAGVGWRAESVEWVDAYR